MTPQEAFQSWLLPYAAIGLGLLVLAIGAILVVATTTAKKRQD